jgi:tetratricopeptide (TPR) repeat protein
LAWLLALLVANARRGRGFVRARRVALAAATSILLVAIVTVPRIVKGTRVRGELKEARQALERRDYRSASNHFVAALELNPGSEEIRLSLARARTGEYVAGGDLAENVEHAQEARGDLEKVLEQSPRNEAAIEAVASLCLKERKFDEARKWYEKLIAVNSGRKEAYFALGDMVRQEFLPAQQTARANAGMAPEDDGPIRDPGIRAELRKRWLGAIDTGLAHLEKAAELDPNYESALRALALLLRERADLAGDVRQYERDIQAAGEWSRRAMGIREINAGRDAAAAAASGGRHD